MPSFRDTLTLPSPERERRLRDPAVRDQMRSELADPTRPVVRVRVAGACGRDRCTRPSTREWVDRTVTEIADDDGRRPARRVPRPLARRGPRDPVRARGAARRQRAAAATERDDPQPGRDGRQLATAARTSCRSAAPTTRPACSPSGCPTCSPRAGGRAADVDARPRPHGLDDRGVLAPGRRRRPAADRRDASARPTRPATSATPRRLRPLRVRRRGLPPPSS